MRSSRLVVIMLFALFTGCASGQQPAPKPSPDTPVVPSFGDLVQSKQDYISNLTKAYGAFEQTVPGYVGAVGDDLIAKIENDFTVCLADDPNDKKTVADLANLQADLDWYALVGPTAVMFESKQKGWEIA